MFGISGIALRGVGGQFDDAKGDGGRALGFLFRK